MREPRHPSALPFWLTGPRPAVVGHRGAAAHAPENTLASFRLTLGVDAVETDVQVSADQALFLLHDDSLARTTDAAERGIALDLPAASVAWDRLRLLDAGSWFGGDNDNNNDSDGDDGGDGAAEDARATPPFAGEPLALLDDLAGLLGAAFDGGEPLGLDLEIKTPVAHAARTVVDLVAQALASPRWERLVAARAVLVTSFDPEVVELASEALPVPVGLLTATTPPAENVPELADLGLAALVTSHDDLTLPVVAAAHGAGLVVGVYTANRPEDWDRLTALGVDFIVSDDPQALRSHLGR